MRKTIRAFVLVMALAVPTLAGEIPIGVTDDIPNGAAATGYIPNNATGEIPNGAASSTIIEILLSLISLT